MQYEILAASGAARYSDDMSWGADERLEKKVNEYISNGWRPQGGVSSVFRKGGDAASGGGTYVDTVWCFQAMIKD